MAFGQDKEETPVLFRKMRGKQFADDGPTAVFPTVLGTYEPQTMSCYAHIGQHSSCDVGWYMRTRAAKPEEYASLKAELEGAPFGYRLKVYSRMQPQFRKAREKEAQQLLQRA